MIKPYVASGQKLGKLEALRGAAAIYVMLGHTFSDKFVIAGKDMSLLLSFGQEAVILFFMLSGFVIQYSFSRSRDKSFELYFIKRFLRIFIPIVIVFIVNYLIVCYYAQQLIAPDGKELAGNLLMLQDSKSLKPNVICSYFLGNSPLWSLSYEWWFYMVFYFIITKVKRNTSAVVYIIGIIAACTYIYYPNFINRLLMYLSIWWVGTDMAKLYLKNDRINFRNLRIPLICLLIEIFVLSINILVNREKLKHQLGFGTIGTSPYLEFRHFAFAFVAIAGSLVWHKIHWKGFSYLLGWFEPFAKISFGIYISHWFLVSKAHYLDSVVPNELIRYIMYFTICFVFAFTVERLIYPYVNKKALWLYNEKIKRSPKAILAPPH